MYDNNLNLLVKFRFIIHTVDIMAAFKNDVTVKGGGGGGFVYLRQFKQDIFLAKDEWAGCRKFAKNKS